VLTVSEETERGVVERRFDLEVGGERVPGIHWLPEEPAAAHPTVLIGHGGTQHKRVPNVLGLGRMIVRHCGFGAVALDAPGHGERMTDEEREAQRALIAGRTAGPDGAPRLAASDPERRRRMAGAAAQAVTEWKALLDSLQLDDRWGNGPFGYWGVSMGTAFGLPLLASEPRIKAGVLGLGALREEDPRGRQLAESIRQPILFIFQWDDELMTREAGLALWDALGSEEKTMHINPGPHVGVPRFELEASVAFFKRHLSN
jgi:dienelactone hydrolase